MSELPAAPAPEHQGAHSLADIGECALLGLDTSVVPSPSGSALMPVDDRYGGPTELITELERRTPLTGPNRSRWRGLTCYRFDAPQRPQWDSVRSLSLCMVVQGGKRLRVESVDHYYGPGHYLVMTRGMRFVAEIREASPTKPFYSLILQFEAAVVNRIMAAMAQPTVPRDLPSPPPPPVYVAACDQRLVAAVLRFLRALDSESDRRVLGPLCLQEVIYRLLQAEQCGRLLEAAAREVGSNPVSAAIRHMQQDLSRPWSVPDLARQVNLSPSAFAHQFKSVTGESPYQFVKRLRLDRARVLLVEEGLSVNEVATAIGYSSPSYFINEFKRHFGVTPGDYAETLRTSVALSVIRSTDE